MDTPKENTFAGLGLSPEILKAVAALGFEEPAPIQASAIPMMMAGHDIVGQSQTGSGKTAAFAIPAIEKIDAASRAVQVLVLCPTRELATQVADEVHKLSLYKRGVHAVPIYGGASYERQFYELKKGVQIVIGTPGRVLDHIERRTLSLKAVRIVVLDEADRMLDMGFREDITRILDATPTTRQTVFFSATMSPPIRSLIKKYSRDAKTVSIAQKAVTVPTVEQWFYEVQPHRKVETLLRLVDYHDFKLGIIFCNTQRMVDELADTLLAQGFSADRLHGGIAQAQRTRVMNKFKKAEFEFLVATDVAGRGIDVEDLELVVNYDLPYDAEDYVHRIGRTGRVGKKGVAITFVSGREIHKLSFIERFTRTRINRGKLPSLGDVEERKSAAMLKNVRGILAGNAFKSQSPLVDRLLEEGFTSTDIAAALFCIAAGAGGEKKAAPVAENQSGKRPLSHQTGSPGRFAPPEEFGAFGGARRPRRAEWKSEKSSYRTAPGGSAHVARISAPSKASEPPIPPVPSHASHVPPGKLNRGGPAPVRERLAPQTGAEPIPHLRLAPKGSQWVRLSVGWHDRINPKLIVALLEETLGASPQRVGMIELTNTQSFAQVGKEHLSELYKGPMILDREHGPVQLSVLPEQPRPEHRDRQANKGPKSKGHAQAGG